jgi:nucleotide-binding universal stress UspA family protein
VLDDDPTFDLVIMGSHGRTGIRRVLLGSVAEKVVRHARRPVLVARKRA